VNRREPELSKCVSTKKEPLLESLWRRYMVFRVLVVLTSPWWISMGFVLLVFAGAPVVGLAVGAFGREVPKPFRVLCALALPTYATLYILIERSFESDPGGAGGMGPLFGFLANAGSVVLLLLGAVVLFAALAGGERDQKS
jgi:hypothetical protein